MKSSEFFWNPSTWTSLPVRELSAPRIQVHVGFVHPKTSKETINMKLARGKTPAVIRTSPVPLQNPSPPNCLTISRGEGTLPALHAPALRDPRGHTSLWVPLEA